MPLPPPTIVFDLDGTLIDSAPHITAALTTLLATQGLPPIPVEAVTEMIGDGAGRLLAAAYRYLDHPVDAAELDALRVTYEGFLAAHAPGPDAVFPGVVTTLDRLRAAGYRMAVCSNKPDRPTQAAMACLRIDDRFDSVIGARSDLARKPAPDMLLAVLRDIGGIPARAVMVGDNANDVGAARAAGMPVVAVTYGYPRMPVADLGADRLIDRMADLPDALIDLSPSLFGGLHA